MAAKDLSIILPAYLEEENLRLLLPRIKQACQKLTPNYEILVVDTMTPMDGTPEACQENTVIYLNRSGGNNYGDAVRTGIEHAQGENVIFMDADGSHHPGFISNLYEQRKDYEVVIASRYIQGGMSENSKTLILMSRIVNLGYSLVLNLKCKDVSNSFKLFHQKDLKELKLKCNNFDIVEEILYKVVKNNPNISIKEIPFSFKQRMFGETKRNLPAFIFTYILTLIKLRFL